MVSTYSTNLRLDLQGTGDNNGTWGTVANTDFSLIDDAIAGYVKVSVSGGDTALSTNNGSSDNARKAMIEIVGSPTSAANVIIPANSKQYIVRCSLSNSTAALVKISGTTGYTLTNGVNQYVITDGTTVTGESVETSSGAVAGSYSLPMISVNGFGVVTSISTLASVGIAVQTSSGPTVRRVSAGTGVTVTNPDGAAGDFIVALSATGVTSATYGNARSFDINSVGQVVSVVSATSPRVYTVWTSVYTAYTTVTGTFPGTTGTPTNTDGQSLFSFTITPQTSASTLRFRFTGHMGATGGVMMGATLLKGSSVLTGGVNTVYSVNQPVPVEFEYQEVLTTIAAVSYSVRVGIQNSSGVGWVNGGTGGAQWGGKVNTTLVVEEII